MLDIKHKNDTVRFGVMCDGVVFPAWQAHWLEILLACPGLVPTLLIINDEQEVGDAWSSRLRRVLSGELWLKVFIREAFRAKLAQHLSRLGAPRSPSMGL